jgi:hypothetical protein
LWRHHVSPAGSRVMVSNDFSETNAGGVHLRVHTVARV